MNYRQIEILEIASILLETSRQDSNDKSKSRAYTEFDTDTIFEYGCDRLNGATALYDSGYCRICDVINYLEAFNRIGNNTYAIKLLKQRFMYKGEEE